MAFEKHLFISYAHIDNQTLSPKQKGWISRFHDALQVVIDQHLGRKADIWRDDKLRGNDVFGDEIVAQFPKTALFLSVMTPRYVQSDWCAKEMREFCSAAEHAGGVVVGNKSRIIKVIKTPFDRHCEAPLPPVVQQMLGYEFYDSTDGTPVEFDEVFGVEPERKFYQRVLTVGVDVVRAIKMLEGGGQATAASPTPRAKAAVYLAECSYDRRDQRNALKAELEADGYTVLPGHQLPADEAAYRAEATRLLSESVLSIHLVGAAYGAVPDGPSQKSVVALQNDVAAERSDAAGLKRLIWLPAGTTSPQAQQQQLIDTLQSDARALRGADLATGSFESLKRDMHATLKALEPRDPAPVVTGDAAPLVYVICDSRDRKATLPLRQYLSSQGLEVKTPVVEGSPSDIRQANDALKDECDAVIVYYGAGDEAWKTLADNDVRQIKRRRTKPLARACTYLAAPVTNDKQELVELQPPDLINALDGLRESDLGGFVDAVRR